MEFLRGGTHQRLAQGQLREEVIAREVFMQEAQKQGLDSGDEYKNQLELARQAILIRQLFENWRKKNPVADAEVQAEYDKFVAANGGKEYKVRHILVEKEDQATKILADLKKGAKFEDLAKRESMDGSKDQGGDLSWFTPDRMVKPFSDAVVSLKPGEFTHTPVQTQYGWHVIKLEETRDLQAPAFDSVKQRLEQMVQAKKFKTYADELMKTAKVEKTPAPAAAAAPKT